MSDTGELIKFLSNSPQRHRILDNLAHAEMDVRSLMQELDSSRSTVQRNLRMLEDRGWIRDTSSGYVTTTIGEAIYREFMDIYDTIDTIHRMSSFLEVVDTLEEVEIRKLTDATVMTPKSNQPTFLMDSLFTIFSSDDYVRGLLPVVSSLSVKIMREDGFSIPSCSFIVSKSTLDKIYQQYSQSESGTAVSVPECINFRVCSDELPYGLFVSNKHLALAGYNELGRIQALVKSTNETAIEWAEGMYKYYSSKSKQPQATDIVASTNPD